MKNLTLSLAAAAAMVAASVAATTAQAAPVRGDSLAAALAAKNPAIVDAQYSYRGRSYCFYPQGWRGPGWYRCGYHWRRGHGWGGTYGWRGWHEPRWHHRYGRDDRRRHRR